MSCKATQEINKELEHILVILVTLLSSFGVPSGDLAEGTRTRVCTVMGVSGCMLLPFSIPLGPLKQVNSERAWSDDLCHCHGLLSLGDPVRWGGRAWIAFTCKV